IAFPVASGAADAAVHHQVLRAFGDVGIQVVLDHPVRRLGQPGTAAELGTARCANGAGGIMAGGHGGSLDSEQAIIAGSPVSLPVDAVSTDRRIQPAQRVGNVGGAGTLQVLAAVDTAVGRYASLAIQR